VFFFARRNLLFEGFKTNQNPPCEIAKEKKKIYCQKKSSVSKVKNNVRLLKVKR